MRASIVGADDADLCHVRPALRGACTEVALAAGAQESVERVLRRGGSRLDREHAAAHTEQRALGKDHARHDRFECFREAAE